mmetsp:Transcript_37582/g.76866  ORF Transcript_37582/g.76866 Transcript_37582/m.76866 type:complete len:435 (+) Transcript_37582:32-1336(+)
MSLHCNLIVQSPVKMKLYLSILVTACGLTAAEPDNAETSRTLREDPLNLRGWPKPSPAWQGTQIPTVDHWPKPSRPSWPSRPGTQIPTTATYEPTTETYEPTPDFDPPTTFDPTVECGPSIDDYTTMDKGVCLDGNGETYNFIRFDDIASAKACSKKCDDCAAEEAFTLQGVEYNSDRRCRCRVDEDGIPSGVCESDGRSNQKIGFGKVVGTNFPNSNWCCFRNDRTSAAPSVSLAPSTSLVPSTSSAPSKDPTQTPSLFPSISLSPTIECGSAPDDYSNIGGGRCLDDSSELYNFIRFFGVQSKQECADLCYCVAETLTLRGFDYDSDSVDNDDCRCLVDENVRNKLRNARNRCGDDTVDTVRSANEGFWAVKRANGNPNFCCYKYEGLIKTTQPCDTNNQCRKGCCYDRNNGQGKRCVNPKDYENDTCPNAD